MTTNSVDQAYDEILRWAQTNPDILGFVLCGSRGKGFATDLSDYDCVIVVDDIAREDVASRVEQLPAGLDVAVFTLQEFDEHAAWGQPFASCRYDFAHLPANVDKTGGTIQRLIDEKAKVPAAVADHFVRVSLDHYINQVYRSIKCHRDGNTVGFFLEANQSVRPLLDVVFAIHDRQLRPYYKYLEWELTQFPLERCSYRSVLRECSRI
jgi:hypothetical protein